jgi:hypothetical protein
VVEFIDVKDDLLLALVGASATLLGLFLVGVFFFVDSPIRRKNPTFEPYLRIGTSIVLLVYAIPLIAPLVLIMAGPFPTSVVFAAFSVALIVQNVRTVYHLRRIPDRMRTPAFVINEAVGTILLLGMVALPWVLGGAHPTREHLAASFVLALVAAFVSTCTFVVAAFDLPTGGDDRERRRISRIRMRR